MVAHGQHWPQARPNHSGNWRFHPRIGVRLRNQRQWRLINAKSCPLSQQRKWWIVESVDAHGQHWPQARPNNSGNRPAIDSTHWRLFATPTTMILRACRGPSGESAVAACRLFVRKNATICCQLITVPPRFFYPRPRGPYDGRGASTIRRGTRRIVEQMKMMQKVSHSINSYLILCFRIQRNQFLPSPASSQGNEVQRAWRR